MEALDEQSHQGRHILTADRTWKADVPVESEKIAEIRENLTGDEAADAPEAYVITGGTDSHTHLEMPFMGMTVRVRRLGDATGGTTVVADFVLPGKDGSRPSAVDARGCQVEGSDLRR